MDGMADVEIREHRGSLIPVLGPAASRVHGFGECAELCRRIENYWRERGIKNVRCAPQAKEYRGFRLTGEQFVARYWEVSSVGIPTTGGA